MTSVLAELQMERGLRLLALVQVCALTRPLALIATSFDQSGAWTSAPFSERH